MTTSLEYSPSTEEDAALEQANRAEAVRRVLREWLADESGYDERVWPELKHSLEDVRTSSRSLFRE